MFANASSLAYVLSSLLFVLSLRGLSTQESARRGNRLGAIGMFIAVLVTALALFLPGAGIGQRSTGDRATIVILGAALAAGFVIGRGVAARVAMTAMPELVAILHSFVGAAAVLVGISSALEGSAGDGGDGGVAHQIETYVGVFIGAVTFTGSVVAFLKLRGSIGSRPLLLRGRHAGNALLVLACVVLSALGFRADGMTGVYYLLAMTALAGVLGAHLVLAIGGGDMPVVVSLLNSYSGWTASAAGFMLNNDLLIITGALVGASGAILSYIMCKAMNRSIWNVVFAGFGEAAVTAGAAPGPAGQPQGKVTGTTVPEAADLLLAAKSVVVVPGYGMAVAQAQHPVKEITSFLQKRGVNVRYAIHPVAGRLPGHMNVLLAEANVSYEIVKEMDEINEDFPDTDVVVVIGANDIVNPSALTDPSSPIYGMPVLEVWKASRVIMLKRGMNTGYAGVDNPLCYYENTLMLFGDAKQSVLKLLAALQGSAD